MTFLEKLEAGYFRMSEITPLNVGQENGYPAYKKREVLTAEKYNEATYKIDEIANKTNENVAKIIQAILSLNDDVRDVNEKIPHPDNVTLRINPDTGKLEVINVPDPLVPDNNTLWINPQTGKLEVISVPDINSNKIKYFDPDTGQGGLINIGRKIKNNEIAIQEINEKLYDYVSFINKGNIENYENI